MDRVRDASGAVVMRSGPTPPANQNLAIRPQNRATSRQCLAYPPARLLPSMGPSTVSGPRTHRTFKGFDKRGGGEGLWNNDDILGARLHGLDFGKAGDDHGGEFGAVLA